MSVHANSQMFVILKKMPELKFTVKNVDLDSVSDLAIIEVLLKCVSKCPILLYSEMSWPKCEAAVHVSFIQNNLIIYYDEFNEKFCSISDVVTENADSKNNSSSL